jgi:hypothetical protein
MSQNGFVLEKTWLAPFPRTIAHRLEGSRFGACAAAPQHSPQRRSRRRPTKTGGSRERFGVIHLPMAFGFVCNPSHRTASRWAIPGSRLLRPFVADDAQIRLCEVIGLHAKAAPLQTLGTNRPRQRTRPFEDETSRAVTWPTLSVHAREPA